MANIAVITGVSRGLGESLASLFLESGTDVIGISRTSNKQLEKIAEENNQIYRHFPCDLANIEELEETIASIDECLLKAEQENKIGFIYVINNAGIVFPINQAAHIKTDELMTHMAINAIAPMVITNSFLNRQSEYQTPMVIANVSSGAAKRPVYGWSAYCSSKASLNMFTKTVALELDELQSDHKIIAFSPGIMDTDMQTDIRQTKEDEFKEVEQFKAYKETGALRETDIVAGILIDIITDESVKNGKIYDVKTYF